MSKSIPVNSPSRTTFLGAATRLHNPINPRARLSYHAITNKSIYFIAQYWKNHTDPIRANKETEINYLILLHFAERDLTNSLKYSN